MNSIHAASGAIVAVLMACLTACPVVSSEEDDAKRARKEKAEKEGKARKEKAAKKAKKEGVPQSNFFTRFWIHTVGGPMARGLKDGTKDVYKGLRSGTHMIKERFMGIGGYKKSEKKGDGASSGDRVRGGRYSFRRERARPIDWSRYPGLKAALEHFGPQKKESE
jgi:hypothetical protein